MATEGMRTVDGAPISGATPEVGAARPARRRERDAAPAGAGVVDYGRGEEPDVVVSSLRSASPALPQPLPLSLAAAGVSARSPLRDSEVMAFWRGRIVLGPDARLAVVSALLILVPSLVLVCYTAIHPAVAGFGAMLTKIALAFLARTATTDPGFILRQPAPRTPAGALLIVRNVTETIDFPLPGGGVRQAFVERRWCYTCNILRPPRASHCPYSNACVERYDHYCPWTGTAIGARNYRYFLGFVYSTALLGLYVVAVCLAGLFTRRNAIDARGRRDDATDSFWLAARETKYMEFVLVLYGGVFFFLVGGLAAYHVFLVSNNMTTHEEMRSKHAAVIGSPFDVGCIGNMRAVCCVPLPPSAVMALCRGEPLPPPPTLPAEAVTMSTPNSGGFGAFGGFGTATDVGFGRSPPTDLNAVVSPCSVVAVRNGVPHGRGGRSAVSDEAECDDEEMYDVVPVRARNAQPRAFANGSPTPSGAGEPDPASQADRHQRNGDAVAIDVSTDAIGGQNHVDGQQARRPEAVV